MLKKMPKQDLIRIIAFGHRADMSRGFFWFAQDKETIEVILATVMSTSFCQHQRREKQGNLREGYQNSQGEEIHSRSPTSPIYRFILVPGAFRTNAVGKAFSSSCVGLSPVQ